MGTLAAVNMAIEINKKERDAPKIGRCKIREK